MENNSSEKNSKLNKDLTSSEDISFKTKVFNFYFYTLRKKDINLFLCILLIFLETLQLISYSFTTPHMLTWNLKSNTIDYIQLVVGAPRITPLMKYLSFNYYIIIYAVLLGYIFVHCLVVAMIIKFNKTQSKFYQFGIAFTRYSTTPITIFLMIPVLELVLLPLKCTDGKVAIVKDSETCWDGLHYLYTVLGILFALVFCVLIFFSTMFYFDPFNTKKTTTKIDTSCDMFLYFCKIVIVVRFIAIKNEYISIVIMLVLSLFLLKKGYENPTYSNYVLECVLSIRNASLTWTFLVLFIGKLAEHSRINGMIYLLVFGYPLIIAISVIYYRKKSQKFMITSSNFNDIHEFVNRMKYLIKLIDSFLSKNKSGKANKGNSGKKEEILLKGTISIHEENCVTEECPLKKFEENANNFAIQKTCLLHYMNNLFTEGIKKFPNSRLLLMIFVQFNYEKKYNLNAAKTYLTKLEKQKNTLIEDYIIFTIKQNIASHNNKMNIGLNENEEMLRIEETIEQKYKRLKFLVETTTKLYGEFWGILATNLTNNLNLNKLFMIGNKLNKFLNEINVLWERDLKNKKINLENQSIAQLYAYFLREILKNKKRSDEITKKLNEEQHYESRKTETDKFDLDNLDIILENQDCVIYSRTNEKGECDIIQCSNSIVNLLGFVKQELIGKNIETIMPSVFSNEHEKMLSTRIKVLRTSLGAHKDNFRTSDKKQIFILPKTKVGFLIPVNARFTVYNDDDFSNTYIIKAKFEGKDTKSIYAFYVLTKEDFTVDSISSSAINLGLSMDLLKKYVINMNVLVRSENNKDSLNLIEQYIDYEEEPKKITWVFPDYIYPKNDNQRNKDENINELITISEKKSFYLLITKMKYDDEEPLGYCFRFTEVDNKKTGSDPYDFNTTKTRHIIFDLMKLNYIRTVLVKEKSKNYQDVKPIPSQTEDPVDTKEINNKKETKRQRRKDNNKDSDISEEENEDDKKIVNLLTKEKIIELHSRNSDEVKFFIFGLPFFGAEVSLEKHRPNKEKYPVGKAQEPEIKIHISSFIKRIEEKLKSHPERKREQRTSDDSSASSTFNSFSSTDTGFSSEFSTDVSSSLGNIFNEKSVTYIQIFSFVFFLIICSLISAEFALSLNSITDSSNRMKYMDKSFIILNSLVYTKFFLTETIISKDPYNIIFNDVQVDQYMEDMMTEMQACRDTFTTTYNTFANANVKFSKEYEDYTKNTQVFIKTLSNGIPTTEHQPFSTAMSRIPTSIFYVSTVTDNINNVNMTDRNAFELMHNLLNDYLLVWRKVTFIIVDDVLNNAKSKKPLAFIFGFSFLITVVCLILLWKLIIRFIDDREKPVDLFLTIKKKKFEELKNASESFTNKLLNKFFGNEETEEESLVDYSTTIKQDDINITKFKTKNDYKQSFRTSSEYLVNYIKIVVFLFLIQAYLTFKFCYGDSAMKNINEFAKVFNVTHYSQSDVILCLDITKSFFFDDQIPILNRTDTNTTFQETFVEISNTFESLLIVSFNTTCLLKSGYIEKLYDWMNKDIQSFVTGLEVNDKTFLGTLKYGYKSTISRYFELIRFIGISFLKKNQQSEVTKEDKTKFLNYIEFNEITRFVIKPWYENLIKAINKDFDDFIKTSKVINISTFIVVICCVVLLYCLVWKSYEENLKDLLKTSVDLINLIPEEIKHQIVQKLNEEENKND